MDGNCSRIDGGRLKWPLPSWFRSREDHSAEAASSGYIRVSRTKPMIAMLRLPRRAACAGVSPGCAVLAVRVMSLYSSDLMAVVGIIISASAGMMSSGNDGYVIRLGCRGSLVHPPVKVRAIAFGRSDCVDARGIEYNYRKERRTRACLHSISGVGHLVAVASF